MYAITAGALALAFWMVAGAHAQALRYFRASLVALCFVLASLVSAYEVGETFRSSDSHTYKLVKKTGEGDFGNVWIVEDTQSHGRFAVKFFKEGALEQSSLDMYSSISVQQERGWLPHLIRSFGPEILTPVKPKGAAVNVVRLGLGDSNLESLEQSRFALSRTRSPAVRFKRLENAQKVLHSSGAGVLEMKNAGLNHHDLNPRNILAVGDDYVIGDLDEVRPHGVVPRVGAIEYHTGPIDYDIGGYSYSDDNISDLHQLANSLYKLLFGSYRLDEILSEQTEFKTLKDLRVSIATNRNFEKYDKKTRAHLAQLKQIYFPNLNQRSLAERRDINEVFGFLEAGLMLDSQARRAALAQLPLIKNFDLNYDAALKEANSAKEYLKVLKTYTEKLDDEHRKESDHRIIQDLERFKAWGPTAEEWRSLKVFTRYPNAMTAAMKMQLGAPPTISTLRDVIDHGYAQPSEALLIAMHDEVIQPAIESGQLIHSLHEAIEVRNLCTRIYASLAAIEAGLPYADTLEKFLSLTVPNFESARPPYIEALRFVISKHIGKYLEQDPDPKLLRNLDPRLLNPDATVAVDDYIEEQATVFKSCSRALSKGFRRMFPKRKK